MHLVKSTFWLLRRILFLALCIVPSLAQVSYAHQQTDPVTSEIGQIAFTSFGMNGDIFVANADGTNVCRLTYSDDNEYSPQWSPDGTQIAFSSRYRGVFVMNSDGSNLRRLGPGGAPQWSPDGTKIAFWDYPNRTITYYIVMADGTNLHQLTDKEDIRELLGLPPYPPLLPDNRDVLFSPDSNKIVLVIDPPNKSTNDFEIYLMNADGSNYQRLADYTSYIEQPVWSPDSRQIIFVSIENDNVDLYIIDADGENLRNLTEAFPKVGPYDSHRHSQSPAWSPDGSLIAFDSQQNYIISIYVMNADGSNVHEIIPNAHSAAWAPAGTPPRALMATIAAPNKINVRSAPSAKSAIVDSIAPIKNRCMVVLGRSEDNSWAKIRNPFSKVETGWVNVSLLEVRGDLLSVPIMDQ